MDKYRIDYMDADGEIITMTTEVSRVLEGNNVIIFCDEHGEDDYVFYKKDIVSYKKEK